jgi:hypothetical protein
MSGTGVESGKRITLPDGWLTVPGQIGWSNFNGEDACGEEGRDNQDGDAGLEVRPGPFL